MVGEDIFFKEYFAVLVFFGLAFFLSVGMILLSYRRASQNPSADKLSSYECGFEPFSTAPGKFNARFYVVALLFIVFDVEMAFLFPWAISLQEIGVPGFLSMMLFLGILTIGFLYEWKQGVLEWE